MTKAIAVAHEPYRRSPPIRLPGARLTISAPTMPNIAKATMNGSCSGNDSPFTAIRMDPTIASAMNVPSANQGHRAGRGGGVRTSSLT